MEFTVKSLGANINLESEHLSAEEIDAKRHYNIAYQYLCHLEEARVWIQNYIKEKLPVSRELDERLRNGVYFAKVAHSIDPDLVPLKKIYDIDQKLYDSRGLHFRHTDNINYWLFTMKSIGLPSYFHPSAFDVYEKKNMPKAIYCIHALSVYLHKLGRASEIRDLHGRVSFSEEDISTVEKEFKKYGIQLPAFGKIGGILAKEINASNAAFHASVIAINTAIDRQNSEILFSALSDTNSKLQCVSQDYIDSYKESLYTAKTVKSYNADHRLVDSDYIPDIYDCLLTQNEIQQEILAVNQQFLLTAVVNKDAYSMRRLMSNAAIGISEFVPDFVDDYLDVLLSQVKLCSSKVLDLSQIQKTVTQINRTKCEEVISALIIFKLNTALEASDYKVTYSLLKTKVLQMPELHDFAADSYHKKLLNLKRVKFAESDYFKHTLSLLHTVQDNSEIDNFAHFFALDDGTRTHPKEHLNVVITEVRSKKDFSNYLSYDEVRDCIVKVNMEISTENMLRAVEAINSSLFSKCATTLINCILNPEASVSDVVPEYKDLYLHILCSEMPENMSGLLHQEIQQKIIRANEMAADARCRGMSVVLLNIALENQNHKDVVDALSIICKASNVFSENAEIYYYELEEAKKKKFLLIESMGLSNSNFSWISSNIIDSMRYYFNIKTQQSLWASQPPSDISVYLCEQDIVNTILLVNYDVGSTRHSLQRCTRGFQFQKTKFQRNRHFQRNLDKVIRIQRWWRTVLQQKAHSTMEQYTKNLPSIIKIQTHVKMWLARKKFVPTKRYLAQQENSAKIIQKHWRAYKAKQNLRNLLHSPNPSLAAIQKLVHLWEINDEDYSEEFTLQSARGNVVRTIRQNQLLQKEVDEMDLKIGLLVQNRITMQELVSHRSKMRQRKTNPGHQPLCALSKKIVPMLNKDCRQQISIYENLFYLLQTEPKYLAKLMCTQSSIMSVKLIESTIFSLYNYGSTPREEYLLLRLFETALQEEIRLNVEKLSDTVTGNSLIIKFVVAFYKNGQGQGCLRELLEPLVQKAIDNEALPINIDPVEVYRIWINELEVSTGRSCDLPYEVTVEEAMKHDEIQKRLKASLKKLVELSSLFCDTIVHSQDLIPYGIMYIAKVLKDSLVNKFPETPLKEVLKTVGNLLYYRYINSSIVAPDAFHIITLDPDQTLTNQQRKSLGVIAKILQLAASDKYFTNEKKYLTCLNLLLQECHTKFMKFFQKACETQDLEEHFDINTYSEATLLVQPVVYLTAEEIFTINDILVKHEETIAPDSTDPLHEILEDLSMHNVLKSLWGDDEQLLKKDICLTLQNKYYAISDDEPHLEQLYVETKQMTVVLLRVLSQQVTISKMIRKIPSSEEKQRFNETRFSKTVSKEVNSNKFMNFNKWDSLSAFQKELQKKLNALELVGYVSSKNDYQDVLNSLAKDIRNRWNHRESRKKEILKLKNIQKQLDVKTAFYEEKLDYYNRYVKACLSNLSVGPKSYKSILRKGKAKELKTRTSLKFSGAKLHEKGILLEIRDLKDTQLKNVTFEISPTEATSNFLVTAKFLDLTVVEVEIDIQELLNLQYQGVAITEVFEGVKVNVNLLIFLLNSKFYGKKI